MEKQNKTKLLSSAYSFQKGISEEHKLKLNLTVQIITTHFSLFFLCRFHRAKKDWLFINVINWAKGLIRLWFLWKRKKSKNTQKENTFFSFYFQCRKTTQEVLHQIHCCVSLYIRKVILLLAQVPERRSISYKSCSTTDLQWWHFLWRKEVRCYKYMCCLGNAVVQLDSFLGADALLGFVI